MWHYTVTTLAVSLSTALEGCFSRNKETGKTIESITRDSRSTHIETEPGTPTQQLTTTATRTIIDDWHENDTTLLRLFTRLWGFVPGGIVTGLVPTLLAGDPLRCGHYVPTARLKQRHFKSLNIREIY